MATRSAIWAPRLHFHSGSLNKNRPDKPDRTHAHMPAEYTLPARFRNFGKGDSVPHSFK